MVARKKNSRQRGGTTHGWGSMKKHRGKGNKGGAGNAGTGKRGDAKKPSHWKEKYFGKQGFKKGLVQKLTTINLNKLQDQIPSLLQGKLISQEADTIIIDAKKIKIDKLLGSGKVTQKMKITVDCASKSAVEKIKEKGGEVITKQNVAS